MVLLFFLISLFLLNLIFVPRVEAVAYTWDGGGVDANWNTANNWSSNIVPTSADTVTFDNACASNCSPTINANVTVAGLTMAANYAGTITQAAGVTLTVNGTLSVAGGTFVGGNSTIDINGSFSQSGGGFTPSSATTTISQNFTLSGGTFTGAGKNLTFDGDISQQSTFNCSGNFNTASNVSSVNVAKTSNTSAFILASGCTLSVASVSTNGPMTVNTGAVLTGTGNWSSNTVTNSGTLSAVSATSTISGNFANTGTFNHNNGTVSFSNAAHTISGSTTFYNLVMTGISTARTLTFTAGTTQTVLGTLNLTGSSGKVLSLRSSSPGTQWSINPQGTRTVSYVNVQDSNNTNVATIYGGTGSTDSLNNTNWVFTSQPPNAPTSLGPTALVEGS